MKRLFISLSASALIPLSFVGCNESETSKTDSESKTLKVVCTTGMIADVVREIGESQVEVVNLIKEGVDPHVYKPTAKDAKLLLGADIVFYNGLHLEGKMGTLLEKVKAKGNSVYAVAEQVKSESILDEDGKHDPHLWMDVLQWEQVASFISYILSEKDSEEADFFAKELSSYRSELQALHQYAQQTLDSIPESQRELITAHDAFGYMERAYKLKVKGIQGLSTESETGLKELESLISHLVEQKIEAVFVESSVNDKNVRALIEGAAAQGHSISIGGELFSDAMGAPGSYEGTYIGMIDHNVTTITRALGGTAPERGFSGKLSTH